MQLSQFKAEAKPRNAWQAIDLGFVIARTAYWKLFFACLIPAAVCFGLFSAIFWQSPSIPIIITWWLKPIWERAPLYIISREIFADSVPLRQVWRNYWSIIKTDFIWWLSIRRFSPTRGFDMPITLLEQLKGSTRRKRLNVLHRRLSNGATWLLIAGAHIEAFLLFGVIAAFFMLVPQGIETNWTEWFDIQSNTIGHIYNAAWLLIMAMVAPFYVCSGFSLYLQRRIDLEGWDIEIRFRDLVERRKQREKKFSSLVPMLAICGILFFSSHSPSSHAQVDAESLPIDPEQAVIDENKIDFEESDAEPSPTPVPRNTTAAAKNARQAIIDVLQGEDFQDIQTENGWRFKEKTDEDQSEELVPDWMIAFADWLDKHGDMFSWLADTLRNGAKLIELLLWIIVISLVLFLILRFRHLIARVWHMGHADEPIEITPPKVMFGLDVTEDSLPDDVVASAQQAWQAGQNRNAIGILLRSAIIKLLHDYKYPFTEGNTERECAVIVERQGNDKISQYFGPLTRQWQAVAYAHRDCPENVFTQLCQQWREVFPNAE